MTDTLRRYVEFYEASFNPPLYAAPWWLNATCRDNWSAIEVKNQESKTIVVFPFYKTRFSNLTAVITPPLTQWLPVLKTDQSVHYSIDSFLRSLPKCAILDLTIKPENIFTNPDQGYRVNFKYSYVIPYHEVKENFKLKYNEGLRRNLREAEKNYTVVDSNDINKYLGLCKSSYHLRNMKPPSWLDSIVPKVVDALHQHKSGKVIMAFDKGEPIAGILTGWDGDTTYYLLGGRTGSEQGSSAHALLLDHAINEAQSRGHKFDFEGSMHSGIANFFQSFGATPERYLQIRKFTGIGKLWSLFH